MTQDKDQRRAIVNTVMNLRDFREIMGKSLSPLWSCGQSSWLQNQRSGFDARHYQIFWEVVGQERGPQPREYNWRATWKKYQRLRSRNREYGRGDPLRLPLETLYPQKLALISPKSGGRLVGIDRSQTKSTQFVCFLFLLGKS
jgi:hypothetical protein